MGSKAALLFMPKGNKIFIQTVSIFEYFGESINALQGTFLWFLTESKPA